MSALLAKPSVPMVPALWGTMAYSLPQGRPWLLPRHWLHLTQGQSKYRPWSLVQLDLLYRESQWVVSMKEKVVAWEGLLVISRQIRERQCKYVEGGEVKWRDQGLEWCSWGLPPTQTLLFLWASFITAPTNERNIGSPSFPWVCMNTAYSWYALYLLINGLFFVITN